MAKILIVEDELYQRELYRLELSEEGHEVEAVSNGEEALDKMRKDDYEIIIMDIPMPYVDGCEALEKIYCMNPDQKVIVYTAYSNFQKSLFSLKADAFVTKSSDLNKLKNKIQELTMNSNAVTIDRCADAAGEIDEKAIEFQKGTNEDDVAKKQKTLSGENIESVFLHASFANKKLFMKTFQNDIPVFFEDYKNGLIMLRIEEYSNLPAWSTIQAVVGNKSVCIDIKLSSRISKNIFAFQLIKLQITEEPALKK